jgi:large subunit ribosomal protein L5
VPHRAADQAGTPEIVENARWEYQAMARLREKYREDIVPALMSEFGYKNPMEVPKLDKIVLNMGIGEATADSKLVPIAVAELEKIAGQ